MSSSDSLTTTSQPTGESNAEIRDRMEATTPYNINGNISGSNSQPLFDIGLGARRDSESTLSTKGTTTTPDIPCCPSPTSTVPEAAKIPQPDTAQEVDEEEDILFECDKLELHLIGKIQGKTGHVMHISYPLGSVVAVDQNILELDFLRLPSWANRKTAAQQMLGTSLQNWVPCEMFQTIFMAMHSLRRDAISRTFRFFRGFAFTISVATAGDYSVMAIEIEQEDPIQASDSYRSSLDYLSRVMELYTNDSIAKVACDNLFDMFPEYDRGMVYRFNDDLSGEIIHEVRRGDLPSSYLGHRFPKYDIPQSARELYKKNVLRYIRDADEEDVPILCKDNDTSTIDLTQLRCRACAKPHLVYMKNMGVKSSMSIAILVDNELWGLFAFHAYQRTFYPTLHQRISCETVASMVSARVEALVRKNGSARIVGMGEALMRWTPSYSMEYNLSYLGQELLQIAQADVLVARMEDGKNTIVAGDKSIVPKDRVWHVLRNQDPSSGDLHTASTRAEIHAFNLTEEDCPASGFVHFREGTTQVFLGRRSVSKDIKWAGNPDQPKQRTNGMLHPRNSFQMYLEKAKQESRSWSAADLNVIMVLKDRICSGHAHEWMTALLKNDVAEANARYFSAMDRAKDSSDFFAHMCHELRTPFHGMLGCLSILHDSIDEMPKEEIKDMIKTALSSGNHMINLLNDILNKSKNKYLLNKTVQHTVRYAPFAREAFGCVESLAVSEGISFDHQVMPNDGDIVIATDRTKIIQIVTNILNNAIKFSCRGSVCAKTTLLPSLQDAVAELEQTAKDFDGFLFSMEEDKMHSCINDVKQYIQGLGPEKTGSTSNTQWLCLSVTDSGCGMKPNDLADMLQPYTQGNASNQSFVGSGLGLYICVSLCQQLNGFISCASTPNNGTNFFVGVPVEVLHQGDEVKEDEANVAACCVSSRIPVSGPLLIVDDNVVNVKILDKQLSNELKKGNIQLELISAYGGEEGFELYKTRLPSISVIDYHMPGMDGIALTKAIRRFESIHNLRPSYILSYTADASDKAAEMLMDAGSNAVMSKPPVKGFIADLVGRMDVTASTEVMTNYRR